MCPSIIESFFEEQSQLVKFLEDAGEHSLASVARDNFRRSLVLAIASYFESELTAVVSEAVHRQSKGSEIVCSLVELMAIRRKYHQWFKWDGNSANQFFSMFGDGFSSAAKRDVQNSNGLDEAVKAFLRLGNTRNLLVHENFIKFAVDMTPEEALDAYRKAERFVAFMRSSLLPAPAKGEPKE